VRKKIVLQQTETMALDFLEHGLHSRNGIVRKLSAALLQVPKRLARPTEGRDAFLKRPPVLANSFPKSGTHLLDQIVAGLPDRVNYGAFLSSMTSSFRLTPRSTDNVRRFLEATVPGEIVRAHLFHSAKHEEALKSLNFVHYFVYRDPRDVVVSASYYLRHMNRWHRLSSRFRALPSDEDGILLSIVGLQDKEPHLPLPNVNQRFQWYEGWLSSAEVCCVRFEDLIGPDRRNRLLDMIEFYKTRCTSSIDVSPTIERIEAHIAPEKSHTFRAGKGGGWRTAFTPKLKDAFKETTGDLLVRLGYEQDDAW
jgi:hypothetical protein